jgi:hypothetical protein
MKSPYKLKTRLAVALVYLDIVAASAISLALKVSRVGVDASVDWFTRNLLVVVPVSLVLAAASNRLWTAIARYDASHGLRPGFFRGYY